jgi:nucleotide-binding universal stress UspA family protein
MLQADRILVHTRGSSALDPVLSRASALAKHCGAQLLLLDVFNELPPEFEPLLSSLPHADAREEAERERRGQLTRIVEALRADGVHAECAVRWGRCAIEIVQEAIAGQHDIVILADDSRDGVSAATQSVVRHCPAPVWVVKNAPHVPPPRIVAAVDPLGPSTASFDRKVLETALAAAEFMRAELYVVHAWQPLHDEFAWLPVGYRGETGGRTLLAQTHARHARAVEGLVRSLMPHASRENCRVIQGSAAATILATVQELGADLLVIGTARSPMYACLLLGKTAEAVLRGVPVSVLAVKPQGFVSPLTRDNEASIHDWCRTGRR